MLAPAGVAGELFINRELSLLAFNRRVLAQAEDDSMPLLERLKFLCIVSSNLDEFFEVRVASLKESIRANPDIIGPDGLTLRQQSALVAHEVHDIVAKQYRVLQHVLMPALAEQGVHFIRRLNWNDAQKAWVREFFFRELAPILTPIGLDPSHPFPRVLNKSLNFVVELDGRDAFGRESRIAIVQAPRILPRVILMPRDISGSSFGFVFLSSILHAHVDELFNGMSVNGCYQFRVTRDTDLSVDEEEMKDLRVALQGELVHRQFGNAVRLEVADNTPSHITEFLLEQFELAPEDLYRVDGPVNLVRLMHVPDKVDRPDLKFPPFIPSEPAQLKGAPDVFSAIRHGDILLHHPFQSFSPVVELLQAAANDPHVVAIKMTVYRTGTDSVLMESLIAAARAGKEVTAVVELMARFDEEANINWAAKLEEVGAHVVYGVVGYKTHAKMLMIVRRENEKLRRYVHLGTGNYHPRTSKLYTDFGLFTCNDTICTDVNDVFLQLTGLGHASELKQLWQSPFTMFDKLAQAINNEINIAKAGRSASIIAKMNSLLEPKVIDLLYKASQAGVKIHLIIRGVCALRPGVPGLSDNINVRSVIGRFLEHTRVWYFHNDKHEDVYLASADWMARNLFGRIEVAFPILDSKVKRRVIREGLRPYLVDNVRAWEMEPDGSYRRKIARAGKARSAQHTLLAELSP
ncbi:polyphosphate kinase 1 [Chitinivorax sp. B]|uniref:polyphosphate kinase 1 n=1 Tax=Chitinivorax sp. B TaxID=2502235 RepID=UPI0010F83FFB|nr:polyphosphate kinase 1 [Chitinivorax sp. B]